MDTLRGLATLSILAAIGGCVRAGYEPQDASTSQDRRGGERSSRDVQTDGGAVTKPWARSYGAKRFPGSGSDYAMSIGVDGGAVYVTGEFRGTADFGSQQLASAGSSDIFVSGYSADGQHRWARRFGGAGMDIGYDVKAAGNRV